MTGFKDIKDLKAVLTAANGDETQYIPVVMVVVNGKNYYIFKAIDQNNPQQDTLLLRSERDEAGKLQFYVVDMDDAVFDMILNQIEWNGSVLN